MNSSLLDMMHAEEWRRVVPYKRKSIAVPISGARLLIGRHECWIGFFLDSTILDSCWVPSLYDFSLSIYVWLRFGHLVQSDFNLGLHLGTPQWSSLTWSQMTLTRKLDPGPFDQAVLEGGEAASSFLFLKFLKMRRHKIPLGMQGRSSIWFFQLFCFLMGWLFFFGSLSHFFLRIFSMPQSCPLHTYHLLTLVSTLPLLSYTLAWVLDPSQILNIFHTNHKANHNTVDDNTTHFFNHNIDDLTTFMQPQHGRDNDNNTMTHLKW